MVRLDLLGKGNELLSIKKTTIDGDSGYLKVFEESYLRALFRNLLGK
jgi:hypothetical protein